MNVLSIKCSQCSRSIVWQNMGANLALGIFKGMIGILSRSDALIADALHSVANAFMAGIIGASLKISNKPVDKNHPYGHGKAEFLFTGLVALLFMAGAIALLVTSGKHIVHGSRGAPKMIAVWAAMVSIVANELVFRRTLCASQKVNSLSISTNAWGSRTDVFSSIAVLVGILLAKLGFPFMDSLAAVLVLILVIQIGVKLLKNAVDGLVDTSLPPEQIKSIQKIVASVDGVETISAIRTRHIGRLLWIDIEIGLKAQSTIAQADKIASQVKRAVSVGTAHVGNVMVYFAPADHAP